MKKYFLKAAPLAVPAVLFLALYILRPFTAVMDAARNVSGVLRRAIGGFTSLFPFSVTEIAGTALGLLALYLIVKTVISASRRESKNNRIDILLTGLVPLLTAAGCGAAVFFWLWGPLYYSTPFYDGVLANAGVTSTELYNAAEFFISGANEYAEKIARGEDNRASEDVSALLARAGDALDYAALKTMFPRLENTNYTRVKPMIYSEIMSLTGFTGLYFALTGEANINVNAPVVLIPETIAHELAHARGVAPENETEFLGIAVCLASGDYAFKYAGYLSGLIRITNALYQADVGAYMELRERYSELVTSDLREISAYWARYNEPPPETINTFGDAVSAVISVVSDAVSDAVNETYDDFLKSQGQDLGILSYGACVDLLTEWVLR